LENRGGKPITLPQKPSLGGRRDRNIKAALWTGAQLLLRAYLYPRDLEAWSGKREKRVPSAMLGRDNIEVCQSGKRYYTLFRSLPAHVFSFQGEDVRNRKEHGSFNQKGRMRERCLQEIN